MIYSNLQVIPEKIKNLKQKLDLSINNCVNFINKIEDFYNNNINEFKKELLVYNKDKESLNTIKNNTELYYNTAIKYESIINNIINKINGDISKEESARIRNEASHIYEKFIRIQNEVSASYKICKKIERMNNTEINLIENILNLNKKIRRITNPFISTTYDNIIDRITEINSPDKNKISFVFYKPADLCTIFSLIISSIMRIFSNQYLSDLEEDVLDDFKKGKGSIEDLLSENDMSLNIKEIVEKYYDDSDPESREIYYHILQFDRNRLIQYLLKYSFDNRSKQYDIENIQYTYSSLDEIIDFYNEIYIDGLLRLFYDVENDIGDIYNNVDKDVDKIKKFKDKYGVNDNLISTILDLYMTIVNAAKRISTVFMFLLKKVLTGYYSQRKNIIKTFNLKEDKSSRKILKD